MSNCPFRCGLLVLTLVGAAACADLDVVTETYASLEEAKKAGAIERGWVPDGLPPGTTDLREAHDLDSNRQWGLFMFPHAEGDALRRLLRPDDVSLTGRTIDIPGRVEWWPVLLRGSLDDEKIKSTGLRAYRSVRGDRLFLVNWQQGRAYYWTIGD
jgi:hypothetical protein